MKEVWFYTYFKIEIRGYCNLWEAPTDIILYSDYFDSFEKAWESRKMCEFPASPVMKGYVKE